MAGDHNTKESGTGSDAAALGAYNVTEHLMSTPEAAEHLATSVNTSAPDKSPGLTAAEVRSVFCISFHLLWCSFFLS
jgi:hypothetical protein